MSNQSKKKVFRFSSNLLAPKTGSTEDVYKLQALLARYGYLSGEYYPGQYDEATRQSVAQFQSFYRLYPTEDGICDAETINLLNQPRWACLTLRLLTGLLLAVYHHLSL